MTSRVTHEELMRYLDGEAGPEERTRIERALETSTELRRELTMYKALKEDMQKLELEERTHGHSIWYAVHRQITRPLGWILLIAGALVWAAYGVYVYLTSPTFLWEKLATGAIVIGILLLFASVVWERYRAWLTDPYRDVQR